MLLALLALLGLVLVFMGRKCARFRRMELALPGPPSLPILGNALDFVGVGEDDILDTLLRLWGGHTAELSRLSIFNNMVVFATDPNHIGKVHALIESGTWQTDESGHKLPPSRAQIRASSCAREQSGTYKYPIAL